MEQVVFYYEVSPLAKTAHDSEGNYTTSYIELKLELNSKPNEDNYEKLQETVKTLVSQQTFIGIEHLKSINQEEYEANH